VVTSIQRTLNRLAIEEYAVLSQRDSPGLPFDLMVFGRPADALALPLDDLRAGGELGTGAHDVEIAAGTLAAGTIAAQRITITGSREVSPL